MTQTQFKVGDRVLHISGVNCMREKYANKAGVIKGIEKSGFEEGGDIVTIDFSENGKLFGECMLCYNDGNVKLNLKHI